MSMKSIFLFLLTFSCIVFSQTEKNKSLTDFHIHHLSEDDTYHSIKLKYGISKRKIIKWNPELKKCKFLSDCSEVLKIKIFINEKNQFIINSLNDTLLIEKFTDSTKKNVSDLDILDSTKIIFNDLDSLDFIEKSIIDTLVIQKKDSIINVAVLFPFFSNTLDSVISKKSSKKINPTTFLTKSRISLSFYSGLLFAFNEFVSDSDLKLNLNVFDTYNNIDTIKKILKEIDFNSTDLIFGPLYQKNFDFFSDHIDNPNVIIVSPLQSNSVSKNYFNNNNIYFSESELDHKITLTSNYIFNKYLKNTHSFTNVSVFLKKEEEKKNQIVSNILNDWRDNVTYYEIEESTVSEQMTDEEINLISDVIFIPSSDPVFVTDFISRLHALKDTNMIVFCNEEISSFNLIPHSELYDLNVHFFSEQTPVFESEIFIKSFYKYFSISPQNSFVQKGYKCGTYFLNLFFKNFVFTNEYEILGTHYKFILKQNNIYRNEAFKLWRYGKYDIKKVLDFNESQ